MKPHLSQYHWDNLIKLNRALLDETSLHRRRTLILEAASALTGQPARLWLAEDAQLPLETAPALLRQVAETGRPAFDAETGMQALPLRHRKTDQFLGALQGMFQDIPAEVVAALQVQTQLALEYPTIDPQVDHLLAISDISRATISELNLDRLLQLVASLLSERFGYPFVHIFLVHSGRRMVEFKAGRGHYATALDRSELTVSLDEEMGVIPWVARNGQSVLINNVQQDSRFKPFPLSEVDIKSELTVPLVFGEQILGVFDVESEAFQAFTPNDKWLLETLAANIAIAVRNAILYRSERWRRRAADSLRQVAGMLRAKETLDNTLLSMLNELTAILPLTSTAIWRKTETGFRCKVGSGLDKSPPSEPVRHPWFEQIVTAKEPLIRQAGDEPIPLAESFPADHSALGAVLQVDDNVLGILVLLHRRPYRFGKESQKLAEIFAGQAAIIIENTELYSKAQEQAWVSTALLQVAEATRNLQTLSEVLAAVTRITPLVAGVDACAIWLRASSELEDPDPQRGTYTIAAWYGFSDTEKTFLQSSQLAQTGLLVIRLGVLKQPLVISPAEAPAELPADFLPFFAGQTTLFLPLLSQGKLNGIMMMIIDPERIVSEQQLRMMNGIAHQAAAAIQTAQLIEAQQAEAYVSTALLQVAQVVATQADLTVILETVTRITPLLTGVSHCFIFLYYGADLGTLAAQYGLDELPLPLEISLSDFPDLQVTVLEGVQRVINAVDQLPPALRQVGRGQPFQGVVIPLGVKGEVVGALMVVDIQDRPILSSKRGDIVTGIAYQTALAVDNARLYAERSRQEQLEHELALAQEIQTAFIPRELPTLIDWQLATFWKTAREVGGDFFDVIPMPHDRLLIVIADVSDKGMPAALFMALTRSLIQATALELDQPRDIFARINQLLLPNNQKNMFVTTFCAVLDLTSGEVSYASAGHNPPILVRQSGQTHLLRTRGIVLGILDVVEFEQKSISLQAGDGILFYTDGITEAFNAEDEVFGEARLLETLRGHWHLPAGNIVSSIHQAVLDFSDPHPQSDDQTLLLLKKNGDGDEGVEGHS